MPQYDNNKRTEVKELHTSKLDVLAEEIVEAAFPPSYRKQPPVRTVLQICDELSGKLVRETRIKMAEEKLRLQRIIRSIDAADNQITTAMGGFATALLETEDDS